FRAAGLDEALQVAEAQYRLLGGGTVLQADRFSTQNRFYGAQLGMQVGTSMGRFSLDLKGKVALGNTHEMVDITGATLTNNGRGLQLRQGGLLAQPTNIGRRSRDVFGVIPEVGVTLGYQVTDYFRVFAGYNFLYWNNVVRPGSQIDRSINVT